MVTNIQLLLKLFPVDPATDTLVNIAVLDDSGPKDCTVQRYDDFYQMNFSIKFPNQLKFLITNLIPGEHIEVQEMWVGPLKLNENVKSQIFLFNNNIDTSVSSSWDVNGTVTVELFAEDWVQYHLLYGNKI